MARIRTVKPDFFKHYELYEAECRYQLPLRIAFAGLWCCADRDGKFKWQPMALKTDVVPYDPVDFTAVLNALQEAGFIRKYTVDGRDYGIIPSFREHQRPRNDEAKSILPDPIDTNPSLYSDDSTPWKGKEGKGKEDIPPIVPQGGPPDLFSDSQAPGCEEPEQEQPHPQSGGNAKRKRERTAFVPPSQEEVHQYFTERQGAKWSAEYIAWQAAKWYERYTSNGWMVGKNKMKDWRSAVRTWILNDYDNGSHPPPTSTKPKIWV